MDDRMDAVKAELEAVSFVGETLAPFFLQDPRTGTAGAAFQAVAQLRAQEALMRGLSPTGLKRVTL